MAYTPEIRRADFTDHGLKGVRGDGGEKNTVQEKTADPQWGAAVFVTRPTTQERANDDTTIPLPGIHPPTTSISQVFEFVKSEVQRYHPAFSQLRLEPRH